MPPMPEWFSQQFFGHSMQAYLLSLANIFAALIGLSLVKSLVLMRLHAWAEKTTNSIDDFVVETLRKFLDFWAYLVVAIFVGVKSLTLPAPVEQALHLFYVVVITAKVISLAQSVILFSLSRWAESKSGDLTSASIVKNVNFVVRIGLWSAGLLFVLDNVGVDVTAFIAGLGVGGVAVALAAQAILGDAFSSFAIYLDKPFEVGDFVIIGDFLGTIEHIGLKTTRIRSLHGEQLIFSNSDLTSSRIKNYKRMIERRIVFTIGVVYQTPPDKVRKIPGIIKDIITKEKMARFDRSHFAKFADFSLNYETVYYVLSADYNQYMDIQQSINFAIVDAFKQEGIEFAYPTQTLFVNKTEN